MEQKQNADKRQVRKLSRRHSERFTVARVKYSSRRQRGGTYFNLDGGRERARPAARERLHANRVDELRLEIAHGGHLVVIHGLRFPGRDGQGGKRGVKHFVARYHATGLLGLVPLDEDGARAERPGLDSSGRAA